jgi:hypothetical protein
MFTVDNKLLFKQMLEQFDLQNVYTLKSEAMHPKSYAIDFN